MFSELENGALLDFGLVSDKFIDVNQTICTFVRIWATERFFHDSSFVCYCDVVVVELVPLLCAVTQYVGVVVATLGTAIVDQDGV